MYPDIFVTGRLIKYEELLDLGCNKTSYYCNKTFYCDQYAVEQNAGWMDYHGKTNRCKIIGQEIITGSSAPSWVYNNSFWSGTPDNTSYDYL